MKPGVSIIIPAYNREQRLIHTVRSAFNQKSPDFNLELVIVDDLSTDDTWGAIQRLGKDIISIRHSVNLGPNAARTTGFRHSSGDYVTFLDSDDLLAPGSIERHLAVLESTGADVCYGNWDIVTEDAFGTHKQYSTIISGNVSDPIDALLSDWWCPPFVYTIRRSCLEEPFPWDMLVQSRGSEDFDLLFQIAFSGARFTYDNNSRGSYIKHTDGRVSNESSDRTNLCSLEILQKLQAQLTEHGQLSAERRHIFARRYLSLAKSFYGSDRSMFRECINQMKRVYPYYRGDSRLYRLLVNLFDFHGAELICECRRKIYNVLLQAGVTTNFYDKNSSVRMKNMPAIESRNE